MWAVWVSVQTTILSLHNIHRLVFLMEAHYALYEVGNGTSYIVNGLKG